MLGSQWPQPMICLREMQECFCCFCYRNSSLAFVEPQRKSPFQCFLLFYCISSFHKQDKFPSWHIDIWLKLKIVKVTVNVIIKLNIIWVVKWHFSDSALQHFPIITIACHVTFNPSFIRTWPMRYNICLQPFQCCDLYKLRLLTLWQDVILQRLKRKLPFPS